MQVGGLLTVMIVAFACARHAASPRESSGQSRGAFAGATRVTRPAGGAGNREHRIIPLRPMSGDVEILSGDPEKAGDAFVMRINELPGTKIPLHSHPVDENITVLQGTWYFAVGSKWDKAALHALRPGDYAFAPKGSTMFGYCPDGAVVQVHGIGPFLIHWGHGLKTLDEAGAEATFTFRKGERVEASRGRGTIRQGYASGDIVQYEIEGQNGRFMADQQELRRI
jgi:quercetin dioxygenase-like cupin family protein